MTSTVRVNFIYPHALHFPAWLCFSLKPNADQLIRLLHCNLWLNSSLLDIIPGEVLVIKWVILWDQVWPWHKYYAPKVRPNQGSNSWPLDHNSTFHWDACTSPGINSRKYDMCSYTILGVCNHHHHHLTDKIFNNDFTNCNITDSLGLCMSNLHSYSGSSHTWQSLTIYMCIYIMTYHFQGRRNS